jgi:hygromycin-B 4-O-kinase
LIVANCLTEVDRRRGARVKSISAMQAGEWSHAYAFDLDGAGYVIRFSAPEEDFAKDRIAGAWSTPALPILAIIETGRALRGWYAITPRIEGTYLEALDSAAFLRVLPALLKAIDAMHQTDVSGSRGFGPWDATGRASDGSWRRYLRGVADDLPTQRTHGWRHRLADNPVAEAAFAAGVTQLGQMVDACPERRQLIHNDLLNRNVLVFDGAITGVIDWGSAMYGDGLYDVALLRFWSPWFDGLRDKDVIEASRTGLGSDIDSTDFDNRLRAYQLHVGLSHIVYNAFKGPGRAEEMTRVCERVTEVGGAALRSVRRHALEGS